MESLPVKYRPKTFDTVCGQATTIKILKRQLETNEFSHAYLFSGPSGDGKTTIARIFANELNHGQGTPIEIDGASNNGVDNVRRIIEDSKARSLDSEYKVIIIDECHAITTQGWQAFLKCIEEPSPYTIFIFCTTDPQKIPATIINRVIRFKLNRIKSDVIRDRLQYICEQEGYTNYLDACDYISKICNGGMRDAISYLEKCASYSNDLNINNVIQSIGNFSYDIFIDLTNGLIDGNQQEVLSIIEKCFDSGADLKVFIDQYLDFCLDLSKYCLFKDISLTKIPASLENPKNENDTRCIKYVTGIENNVKYFNALQDKILNIKNVLRYDSTPKTTISVCLVNICRGM